MPSFPAMRTLHGSPAGLRDLSGNGALMLDDQIKALGKLGRTKRGKQIIRDHAGALCSILGEQAMREKEAAK